jgi:hypothetical protein
MLEFKSNRTPGPAARAREAQRAGRSYRELVADGQAELEAARSAPPPAGERCPHCGHQLAEPTVPGPPPRSPDDASARAAALEASASRLAEQLRDALPAATFDIWIAPLGLADAHADQLFVAAPAELASWVAERFSPLLDRAATVLAGRPLSVVVFPGSSAGRSLGDLIERRPAGD